MGLEQVNKKVGHLLCSTHPYPYSLLGQSICERMRKGSRMKPMEGNGNYGNWYKLGHLGYVSCLNASFHIPQAQRWFLFLFFFPPVAKFTVLFENLSVHQHLYRAAEMHLVMDLVRKKNLMCCWTKRGMIATGVFSFEIFRVSLMGALAH